MLQNASRKGCCTNLESASRSAPFAIMQSKFKKHSINMANKLSWTVKLQAFGIETSFQTTAKISQLLHQSGYFCSVSCSVFEWTKLTLFLLKNKTSVCRIPCIWLGFSKQAIAANYKSQIFLSTNICFKIGALAMPCTLWKLKCYVLCFLSKPTVVFNINPTVPT